MAAILRDCDRPCRIAADAPFVACIISAGGQPPVAATDGIVNQASTCTSLIQE